MIASKRLIALVPTTLAVLVAFTGCKTGLKHNSCGQVSCADTCLTQKGFCLKGLCNNAAPCGQTACGSQCGAGCDCKSLCGSDCNCKVNCGSACAIQPPCQSLPHPETKIPYDAFSHEEPKSGEPTPAGPAPMKEAESADAEKPEPLPMPTPMPKKDKKDKKDKTNKKAKAEKPQPLPAPPMGKEAAVQSENPYMRVAQVQELDESVNVPASHNPQQSEYPEMENAPNFPEEQLQGEKNYSTPWADALGLPSHGE